MLIIERLPITIDLLSIDVNDPQNGAINLKVIKEYALSEVRCRYDQCTIKDITYSIDLQLSDNVDVWIITVSCMNFGFDRRDEVIKVWRSADGELALWEDIPAQYPIYEYNLV